MTAVIARPAHAGSQLRLARGHLPHSRGLQSETRVAGGAGQTHETCLSDDAGRAGTCEDGRAAGEWEVRGDAQGETRFPFRTGITSVVPWLVVS